jgi:hypothetical protein
MSGGLRVRWIDDQGPGAIAPRTLDRVMYLGSPANTPDGTPLPILSDGPQAFLAIQGAGASVPVHFHQVPQFQYFTQGSGVLGSDAVTAGVVHFADGLTPYGPMLPGPDGMAYATVRPLHDPGAAVMPQSAELLSALLEASGRPAAGRRSLTVDLGRDLGDHFGSSGWVDLVVESDGLRIAWTEVPPGGRAQATEAGHGGAAVLVVEGEIDDDGHRGGPGALAWRDPGTEVSVTAGPEGVRIALLQFPTVGRR